MMIYQGPTALQINETSSQDSVDIPTPVVPRNLEPETPFGQTYKRRYYESKPKECFVESQTVTAPSAKRLKHLSVFQMDINESDSNNNYINYSPKILLIEEITNIFQDMFEISKTTLDHQKIETVTRLFKRPSYIERLKAINQLLKLFECYSLSLSVYGFKSQPKLENIKSFHVSYSVLSLYSILWYSPSLCKNEATMDVNIVSESFKHIISKMKIALLFWFIKHGSSVNANVSLDHVMRSLELFDFNCIETDVPPQVFEEVSNHIARLALLGNFPELFQLLHVFESKDDRLASVLTTALLSPHVVRSISAYKSNLFNPDSHSRFLTIIQNAVKTSLIEEDINISVYLKRSVFAKTAGVLSGDETLIDFTIFRVFPNSWLASFIIGIFWRNLEQPKIVSELCQVAGDTFDEVGDFVAFFFASWLESHPKFEDTTTLSNEPFAYLLSNDISKLTKWLDSQSELLISPVLIELLICDHHFSQPELKAANILLKFIISLPEELKEIAYFYYSVFLQEGRHESINSQLLTRKKKIEQLEKSAYQRRSRYEYIVHQNEDEIEKNRNPADFFEDLIAMDKTKAVHPIIGCYREQKTAIETILYGLLSKVRNVKYFEDYNIAIFTYDYIIAEEPIKSITKYTDYLLSISKLVISELKKKAYESKCPETAENVVLIACRYEFIYLTNELLKEIDILEQGQDSLTLTLSDVMDDGALDDMKVAHWRSSLKLKLKKTVEHEIAKSTITDLMEVLVFKDPKEGFKVPECFLQYLDKYSTELILTKELTILAQLIQYIPMMQKGLNKFGSYNSWQTYEKEQFSEAAHWVIAHLCSTANVISVCCIGLLFEVIKACIQIPNFFTNEVLIKLSEFWAQYEHQMFQWSRNAPDPWNPFLDTGKTVREKFTETLSKASLRFSYYGNP